MAVAYADKFFLASKSVAVTAAEKPKPPLRMPKSRIPQHFLPWQFCSHHNLPVITTTILDRIMFSMIAIDANKDTPADIFLSGLDWLEIRGIGNTALEFAPGVRGLLEGEGPPTPDFIRNLPSPTGNCWGVYALSQKEGVNAVYVGSGTGVLRGAAERLAEYTSALYHMPTLVKARLDEGWEVEHRGVGCWGPRHPFQAIPRARIRYKAADATFAWPLFATVPAETDGEWSCFAPWSREAVKWEPLCSHSAFHEGAGVDLGATEEQLARMQGKRRRVVADAQHALRERAKDEAEFLARGAAEKRESRRKHPEAAKAAEKRYRESHRAARNERARLVKRRKRAEVVAAAAAAVVAADAAAFAAFAPLSADAAAFAAFAPVSADAAAFTAFAPLSAAAAAAAPVASLAPAPISGPVAAVLGKRKAPTSPPAGKGGGKRKPTPAPKPRKKPPSKPRGARPKPPPGKPTFMDNWHHYTSRHHTTPQTSELSTTLHPLSASCSTRSRSLQIGLEEGEFSSREDVGSSSQC